MSQIKNLKIGLIEELKDIYNAENQLVKALPKMEEKASDPKLKKALNSHLEETLSQVSRLEKIGVHFNVKLTGKSCKAMKGLIEESTEVLETNSENKAIIDALLIGAAQRVEHYEMAAYMTAIEMAKELGEDEVVDILESILSEEKAASKMLLTIATGGVLAMANTETEKKDPGTTKGSHKGSVALMGLVGLLTLGYFPSIALSETQVERDHANHESLKYEADNTGANVRDRNTNRTTSDDQDIFGNETKLLAQIRREILANGNLSTNGQNVKIIVENGKVLLRGPVNSLQEKNWIGDATAKIASKAKVINELEVVPS